MAPPGAGYGISATELAVWETRALLRDVEDVLVPAYRAAVDALDVPSALELAGGCVRGFRAAADGTARAEAEFAAADPYARLASYPGTDGAGAEVSPEEAIEYSRVRIDVATLRVDLDEALADALVHMSVLIFRGEPVLGRTDIAPPTGDPIRGLVRESSTVVDLLITSTRVRQLLGADPARADRDGIREAISLVTGWRSRPANFRFLRHILRADGCWQPLLRGDAGSALRDTEDAVRDQTAATGSFGDVGAWQAGDAEELLSYGATDWAISDEDAKKVYEMIASAAPATRAKLVVQLADMGKLERMCDNLPWRWVKQLHDSLEDAPARQMLRPYFEGEGGGKSLSKVYEESAIENIQEGDYATGYLWTLLDVAHSGLTFGFKDVHDAAYDANQQGWISDDAYWSSTGKAAARSAAMMGATMATGGAAGAWGEGLALGLNAGKTTAQLVGGTLGGASSGVAGQFTADVFDQAFLGKEGFSDAGTYGMATGTGALGGLASGLAVAGGSGLRNALLKHRPGLAETRLGKPLLRDMGELYAARYPRASKHLDNVLTRIRNAGQRSGSRVKVTAQEIRHLIDAGVLDAANVQASLQRIGLVYRNGRIDVSDTTLMKVMPASEVEAQYGPIDPATGKVTIYNDRPTSGGFVGAADDMPPGARATDRGVREALGIDGKVSWYDKYKNPADQLVEVRFKTDVELDTPLASKNAKATGYDTLGGMDPATSHRPGTGLTKGGVREGELPIGAPIEIVDIVPVGHRRGVIPAGREFAPYDPVPPSVRQIEVPVAGTATAPTAAQRDTSRDPHE